jgi:hypothetical protein
VGIAGALLPTARQALFLARLAQVRASHPQNLYARRLSREFFLSFDAEARERLYRCCRSGAENPDSIVGCYILRPEDLHRFGAFFGPLIREHHGIAAGANGGANPGSLAFAALDFAALGLPALSTRVRVGRNLQGFAMPGAMDRAERLRLERRMVGALQALIDDPQYGGRIFSLTPDFGPGEANPNLIDAAQYEALVEAHVMFRSMDDDPYMKSGGLAGDWPYGRACYVSVDRSVIVWIGEEDHLRVISVRTSFRLAEAYERLQSVLAIIEAMPGVAFIRDDTYGFVTSCPSNLGTGLRASVRVSLPGLTAPDADTRAVCRAVGLAACGLAGDRAPIAVGGPVDLSPIRRLFVEDGEILASLFRGLEQLVADAPAPARAA